jgi:hypothetical protein
MTVKDDFNILNKTVCICARRNSGKSELTSYIVNEFKDKFSKIYVVCPTESVNHFYEKSKIVDKKCIFDKLHDDWVNQLIEKLSKINDNKPKEERTNVLLILDDLVCDYNTHDSDTLDKLFVRGRHVNISVIVISQYINLISTVIRNNSDYLIVGQQNSKSIGLIYDEFINILTRKEFEKFYINSIEDYNFLIINCNNVKKVTDKNELFAIIKKPMGDKV